MHRNELVIVLRRDEGESVREAELQAHHRGQDQRDHTHEDRRAAVLDCDDLVVLAPDVLGYERLRIVMFDLVIAIGDGNVSHSRTLELLKRVYVSDDVVGGLIIDHRAGHHLHLETVVILGMRAADTLFEITYLPLQVPIRHARRAGRVRRAYAVSVRAVAVRTGRVVLAPVLDETGGGAFWLGRRSRK